MLTISQALDMAVRHHRAGELEAAERLYRAVLRVHSAHAGVHHNLGNVLQKFERWDEAIASYQRALELDPDDATGHRSLGTALKARGNVTAAIKCFRRALALRPDYAEAHNNLGNVYLEAGDVATAVECFQRAVNGRPDFPGFHFNLGNALHQAGRLTEAEARLRHLLEINPGEAEVLNSLGIVLFDQGRVAEALECYEAALAIRPEHARGRYNRALAWLVLGDWKRGWPEYEWRWPARRREPDECGLPRWDGFDAAERTLLVETEQGLGDTIQFVRFLAQARGRVARVVLRCQRPLLPLLKGLPGVDELAADDVPPPPCDISTPLMSLPGLLGVTVENVSDAPYLQAQPRLVDHWRRALSTVDGLRVGIAWQGNPSHPKDHHRSFPLRQFAALAGLPQVRLISLQKGVGREQLRETEFPVIDLGDRLDETPGAFMDTAAVMHALDLVITADTAIAHLAGAQGIPTWVLLSAVPEWRWLLDRETTPWYSSVRLFRQTVRDQWDDVFLRLRSAVQSLPAAAGLTRCREAG